MNKQILLEEDFSKGLGKWVCDDHDNRVRIETTIDGVLLEDANAGAPENMGALGINFWNLTALEGDWTIEIELEPSTPTVSDHGYGNLGFLFGYSYVDSRRDLIRDRARRTSRYDYLHGTDSFVQRQLKEGKPADIMAGWIIIYHRLNPNYEHMPFGVRVRRNPGFLLAAEIIQQPEDIWTFRHTVRIEKRMNFYQFHRADKMIVSFKDNENDGISRERGYWGIRLFQARVKIYNVRVTRP